MRGEPDQTLPELASKSWADIDGCCWRDESGVHLNPRLGVTDMKKLEALSFENYSVEAHAHRHHVFHGEGRGAELEFARGCPWACTFCNKTLFRNKFRERNLDAVLRRYVEYTKIIATVKRKTVSALVYPAILITLALVLVAIIVLKVVPAFADFYGSFGADLPIITKIILRVSDIVRSQFPIIVAAIKLLYQREFLTGGEDVMLFSTSLGLKYSVQ